MPALPRHLLILPLLIAIALGACATDREASLNDAAARFALDYRWKQFQTVATWVAEEDRDAFLAEHLRRAKGLNVTACKIESIDPDEEVREAVIYFSLTYLQRPSMVERTKVLRTEWNWSDDNRWQMSYDPETF